VFYLAQAYATVERFDEAFHIVDAAVTAARSGAGGDILAQELIRQARIYIAAGRYEHALECTREAAALADPESDTLHALRCPEALSLACLGTGYDAGLARAELVRCTKGRIPVRTSAWLVVHARLAALRGEPREAYRLVASALAHAWIRDYIAVDARMAATSMMREFSARLDAEEQSVLDAEVKENGLFRIARELIEVDEPA
jgi:tetratricopeptide (TPR) repeat protein